MSAHGSDLEEGEIKDDAFEDISECSLSEILTMQEGKTFHVRFPEFPLRFNILFVSRVNNTTMNPLYQIKQTSYQTLSMFFVATAGVILLQRQRINIVNALIHRIFVAVINAYMLNVFADLKDDSDLDQLREEALKSLQDKDEVTEEELYRFEALQSLLVNIEAKEKKSKKRKRKKKSKEKTKHRSPKQKKLNENVETVIEHFSDSSLVSDNSCVCIRNKENCMAGDGNVGTRSWYPKSDLALLDIQNVDTSSNGGFVSDFIPVPKVLNTNVTKTNNFGTGKPIPQISINQNATAIPQRPNQYATVSKHHIRKFNNATLPTVAGFAPRPKTGKYKLVNTSKYVLTKTNLKIDKTFKPVEKSKYCVNHVVSKFPRLDPKDFVIELDEDSGKEDGGDGSNISENTTQNSEVNTCSEGENFDSSVRAGKPDAGNANTAPQNGKQRESPKCDSSVDARGSASTVEDGDQNMSLVQDTTGVSPSATQVQSVPISAGKTSGSSLSSLAVAAPDQMTDRSLSPFTAETRSESVSTDGTADSGFWQEAETPQSLPVAFVSKDTELVIENITKPITIPVARHNKENKSIQHWRLKSTKCEEDVEMVISLSA